MVDAEPATDPGKQDIDRRDERQNRDHITTNLACQDETEQSALGESM